ncbi:Porin [Paraburkholderia piptadeniae]|uniref:Porin n=1 Tax=Paraburkholderia piptadeniae TaxID=1701573 RepID=A0A1N7S1A1_9BURK|nr:porin [Paraburkholderia piptadeniae]SIT41083.1 Porin [Paraburkholderia piptadeniae]
MKHPTTPRTIAAAVAALVASMAAHGIAHAESSITLYGDVDAGITYTNNQQVTHADGSIGGGHNFQFTGGNLAPSRFGLTGSEDIGGGTAVTFKLENSFFTGSGNFVQAGALFNQNAWVGLTNERYGTLTFGRQFDSYTNALAPYASSITWATLYGSHIGDVDNLNAALNLNNAVQYVSPTFAGFSVSGTYSLGGVADDFSQKRGWAVSASYNNAPFSFGIGYLDLNNPLDAALGGEQGYIGDFACSNPTAMYCELQNAHALKAFGAGGSYTIGPATIGLVYTHTTLDDSLYFASATRPQGADARFDIVEVNGTYALSPALTLGAAYIYNSMKTDVSGSPKFHQVNLGATYSLSKRTTLYAVGIFQKAAGSGIGTNPVTGQAANYAQIPNLPNSSTDKQVSVTVGLKHSF